jgi:hypothetical protein
MEIALRLFLAKFQKNFESGNPSRHAISPWHATIEKWRAVTTCGMPLA